MREARCIRVHGGSGVAEGLEERGEGVELLDAEDVVDGAGDGGEVVDQMTSVRSFTRTRPTQQDNRLMGEKIDEGRWRQEGASDIQLIA